MRKIIALTALVLFISACQKETSYEDPANGNGGGGGGGSTNGTKLVMLTQKRDDDTSTATFKYNSSNRIIEHVIKQTKGSISATLTATITRNSSNVITKLVLSSPELIAVGISDIIHTFYYDQSKRCKYIITKVTMQGTEFSDSTLFSYDASNRLESMIQYADGGRGYDLYSKGVLTYTGSNVSKEETFLANGMGGYDIETTSTYEYDSKVNPLMYSDEAYALMFLNSYPTFYSVNNITKKTVIQADPPAMESGNVTYTYNSDNRPATATSTADGLSYIVKYFYQ